VAVAGQVATAIDQQHLPAEYGGGSLREDTAYRPGPAHEQIDIVEHSSRLRAAQGSTRGPRTELVQKASLEAWR
jgi:hypothetical protein